MPPASRYMRSYRRRAAISARTCPALTRLPARRVTSRSSGGFSHSKTGAIAAAPCIGCAAWMAAACLKSLRHSAAAASTAIASGVISPQSGPRPRPASARVTVRPRRMERTSPISPGTGPLGMVASRIQRRTEAWSYRSMRPSRPPAWFTRDARPSCDMPDSSISASSRIFGSRMGAPGSCRPDPQRNRAARKQRLVRPARTPCECNHFTPRASTVQQAARLTRLRSRAGRRLTAGTRIGTRDRAATCSDRERSDGWVRRTGRIRRRAG
jgi:hypothetical protein